MINLMDAMLPNCFKSVSIDRNENNKSSPKTLNTLAPMGQPSKIRAFKNPVWDDAEDDDRDTVLHFVVLFRALCL
jgi:hypothetical protein